MYGIYLPTFTIFLLPNVGKYASPMDPMGYVTYQIISDLDLIFKLSFTETMGSTSGSHPSGYGMDRCRPSSYSEKLSKHVETWVTSKFFSRETLKNKSY